MGHIQSCTCENINVEDTVNVQATVDAKSKKKPDITHIRNRINSVISPSKPRFEEVLTPKIQKLYSKPAKPTDLLFIRCQTTDKQYSFIPNKLVGLDNFALGTTQNIQPAYRCQAEQEKDQFHLSIRYCDTEEEGSFLLRDEAVGLGCFYRLKKDQIVPVGSGMLISIGSQFIIPCFSQTFLQVRLYGGCAKGQVLEYDTDEITIGRARQCRIVVNDPILSKIQCKFMRKNNKWYIGDGDKQPSTNGTWIYLNASTKAYDGMQIRCGSNYYTCNIKPSKIDKQQTKSSSNG